MKDFFNKQIPHNGLNYLQFVELTKQKLDETNINLLDEEQLYFFNYTKLNYQRMIRINKTYKVSDTIEKLINKIEKYQLWMVLTEDWCGDSAQNLPYINKFAELNKNIDLRILERDKNLDIMDNYLTNGKSRSIPKVIAFDQIGNELFIWGPRPKEAELLLNSLKEEGLQKDEYVQKLHLWYGINKGKALEKEFEEILTNL
ncbi:MAG TPA: thioredoxin family protein [Melioribacteraceae bacterium]|nr:thioredoxin family protein [Melioribacteraceae bacterium]